MMRRGAAKAAVAQQASNAKHSRGRTRIRRSWVGLVFRQGWSFGWPGGRGANAVRGPDRPQGREEETDGIRAMRRQPKFMLASFGSKPYGSSETSNAVQRTNRRMQSRRTSRHSLTFAIRFAIDMEFRIERCGAVA